jgi:hypothetical protein
LLTPSDASPHPYLVRRSFGTKSTKLPDFNAWDEMGFPIITVDIFRKGLPFPRWLTLWLVSYRF